LAYPDFEKPFLIATDASNLGIGAVLSQIQEKKERVIAYASRTLNKGEKNYETTKKECIALVWGVDHFKAYHTGKKVTVYTDHKALAYIDKLKFNNSMIARWAMSLNQYKPNITIEYKKGSSMGNADGLSRLPHTSSVKKGKEEEEEEEEEFFLSAMDIPDLSQVAEVQKWHEKKETNVFSRLPSREGLKQSGEEIRTATNQLVVGDKDALKMAIWLHQHPGGAAHYGIKKTLAAFKQRFYNPSCIKIVTSVCASCHTCQLNKDHTLQGKAPLKPILTTKPWQLVSMDIAGPYPESISGNFYLLTIVDAFSGFAITASMKDQSAETVCEVVMNKLIAPFGCPIAILTDQGRQFEGHLFTEMCKILEIKKKRTVSYHPQCNGKNERLHRTLLNMFRSLPRNAEWEQYLPILTLTYNASPGATTKFSPYKTLFGTNPYLPCDLVLPNPPEERERSHLTRIKIIHDAIAATREAAAVNLALGQDLMKHQYDKKIREFEYKIGENILLLHIPKIGEHRKLASRWEGPYRLLRQVNDVNFEIQMENRRKIVHHNQIKRYVSPLHQEVEKFRGDPFLHQFQYFEDEDTFPHYSYEIETPIPQIDENKQENEMSHTNETELLQAENLNAPLREEEKPVEAPREPITTQEIAGNEANRRSSRTRFPRTTYCAGTGLAVIPENCMCIVRNNGYKKDGSGEMGITNLYHQPQEDVKVHLQEGKVKPNCEKLYYWDSGHQAFRTLRKTEVTPIYQEKSVLQQANSKIKKKKFKKIKNQEKKFRNQEKKIKIQEKKIKNQEKEIKNQEKNYKNQPQERRNGKESRVYWNKNHQTSRKDRLDYGEQIYTGETQKLEPIKKTKTGGQELQKTKESKPEEIKATEQIIEEEESLGSINEKILLKIQDLKNSNMARINLSELRREDKMEEITGSLEKSPEGNMKLLKRILNCHRRASVTLYDQDGPIEIEDFLAMQRFKQLGANGKSARIKIDATKRLPVDSAFNHTMAGLRAYGSGIARGARAAVSSITCTNSKSSRIDHTRREVFNVWIVPERAEDSSNSAGKCQQSRKQRLSPSLLLTSEDSPASTSSSAMTSDTSFQLKDDAAASSGEKSRTRPLISHKKPVTNTHARLKAINRVDEEQISTNRSRHQIASSGPSPARSGVLTKKSASPDRFSVHLNRLGPATSSRSFQTEREKAEEAHYAEDLQQLTFRVDKVLLTTPPRNQSRSSSVIRSHSSTSCTASSRHQRYPAARSSRWNSPEGKRLSPRADKLQKHSKPRRRSSQASSYRSPNSSRDRTSTSSPKASSIRASVNRTPYDRPTNRERSKSPEGPTVKSVIVRVCPQN
jgi:transposase InsO family protein